MTYVASKSFVIHSTIFALWVELYLLKRAHLTEMTWVGRPIIFYPTWVQSFPGRVSESLYSPVLLRLYWCDPGYWRHQLNTNCYVVADVCVSPPSGLIRNWCSWYQHEVRVTLGVLFTTHIFSKSTQLSNPMCLWQILHRRSNTGSVFSSICQSLNYSQVMVTSSWHNSSPKS